MKSKDLKLRSVTKAFSYRLNGTLVTMLVVFFLTGSLSWSISASIMDFCLKIFLYYFHERIWDKISWGRRDNVSAVIWFTGLSGAGKSALANLLNKELESQGFSPELLDGDMVRAVFKDTGFGRS